MSLISACPNRNTCMLLHTMTHSFDHYSEANIFKPRFISNLGSQTFPVEMNPLFGFKVNDKTLPTNCTRNAKNLQNKGSGFCGGGVYGYHRLSAGSFIGTQEPTAFQSFQNPGKKQEKDRAGCRFGYGDLKLPSRD